MKSFKLWALVGLCLASQLMSCTAKAQHPKQTESNTVKAKIQVPKPADYVSSPLRNRIQLSLNSSLPKVWEMVGKPENMPKYSAGLEKVDAQYSSGKCTGFTCHFVPMEGQTVGLQHNEHVVWYEDQMGYISRSEEPNNYGYTDGIALVRVEEQGKGTLFSWDIHYNTPDDTTLQMNVEAYQLALDDIASNLVKMFGGEVLESYAFKN